MKTAAIGIAIAALMAPPVWAADMAVKAPPPLPPPTFNWSGCYVGGNVGYAWSQLKSSYFGDPNPADAIQGVGSVLPPSYDMSSASGVGGAQAGCNWQNASPWVLGLEGDIDAVNLRKSASILTPVAPGGTAVNTATFALPPNAVFAQEEISQHWISTVRGRVGYTLTDRLYVFGTAGLAIGNVSTNGSVTIGVPGTVAVWSGSTSTTKAGGAFGGGAEYAVTNHWSVKAEYIYFDLGSVSHPLTLGLDQFRLPSYSTLGNTRTPFNGNIVRTGLNYKF